MFLGDKSTSVNPDEQFRKVHVPQKPKDNITDKTLAVAAPARYYKKSKSVKRWSEREGHARNKAGFFAGRGPGAHDRLAEKIPL